MRDVDTRSAVLFCRHTFQGTIRWVSVSLYIIVPITRTRAHTSPLAWIRASGPGALAFSLVPTIADYLSETASGYFRGSCSTGRVEKPERGRIGPRPMTCACLRRSPSEPIVWGRCRPSCPPTLANRRIWDMSTSSALRVTCTPTRSSWTCPGNRLRRRYKTQQPRTTV